MAQTQHQPTALPGAFSTVAAGFELTTRYLWLMLIPAVLDLFLWVGPRLSFRPLIESLAAQLPAEAMVMDMRPMLEALAPRLNHFTYLGVSFLGVPTLMAGLTPEKAPVAPMIIDGGGWGAWFGYLVLFTVAGLLLAAVYYNLIAYAMRRAMSAELPPLGLGRFTRRATHTWLRLVGLGILLVALLAVMVFPVTLLAGFVALISQTIATFILLGAVVVIIWLLMFLSYTPQGMLLNPRGFASAVADSVRLFQKNLPTSLALLFVVLLARQLLGFILLTADSGTWVTAINILAHAYIATALTVALFLFYRDRYVAYLRQQKMESEIPPISQK